MSKIYKKENGEKTPCIIVSKPKTMEPKPSYPGITGEIYSQNYIMNEIVKKNSTDADIILPFVYRDSAGSAYSYKWNNNMTAMGVYLSQQLNWVNKKEMFTYFNDNHAWSSFKPGAWKAEVHENNQTEDAWCTIAVNDVSENMYSTFIENYTANSGTWSAIKPLNQKSNLDYSVSTSASSDQNLLAAQLEVSSSNNFNVNVGFGMIISGNGLDSYINNVNTTTPLPCSLFAIRVKGGLSDGDAYTATYYNNSIIKFYSFNKKLLNEDTKLNDFSYKKLNNNVYYLYDKSFIQINNSNIESKSIKFTQPYIYTQNQEGSVFSIRPKNGTFYYLYANFSKNGTNTTYYYGGDTNNYQENWTNTLSVNNTTFSVPEDCKFDIPTTSPTMGDRTASGFITSGDYLRVDYDFNNGLTGFMGMPPTHIIALSYYFTKLN